MSARLQEQYSRLRKGIKSLTTVKQLHKTYSSDRQLQPLEENSHQLTFNIEGSVRTINSWKDRHTEKCWELKTPFRRSPPLLLSP